MADREDDQIPGPTGQGAGSEGEGAGWAWMPSPAAIAIAVIGMLALGVGLGSAMSEIASSAPLSTILLEYPHRAVAAPPREEPEETEAVRASGPVASPEATTPAAAVEEVLAGPPPEALPEAPPAEEATSSGPPPVAFNPLEEAEAELPGEGATLPDIKHAFLIVLGEGGYEETFGAGSTAPYLSRVLPRKGELLPDYYGVTVGALANEIALLSGQGPTAETAAGCPNYAAIAPGTVAATAEQVEGDGCVYGDAVRSLPTELSEKGLTWRAYVEDMEAGGQIGQPFRCRKPPLGGPDPTVPAPGDQYATWRNPVVYFSAIAAGPECEKHDVGFELLTKDLSAPKKTPALSLIFPDVCHAGGESECEPGAPKGAQGVAAALKTLVPAIMASPAYQEGGLILVTSAQAPQAGERADPSACCLAPAYPNLPAPATGGGRVGLLLISPVVEPGRVDETEHANHFTLLRTLATIFGVEPPGYAGEEGVPTLSPGLFRSPEEVGAAVSPPPRSAGAGRARAAPGRGAS